MYKTDSGKAILLKNYQPFDFVVETVEMTFDLHPVRTLVTTKTRFKKKNGKNAAKALVLDGDELEFVSASLDGKPLGEDAFIVTPNGFTLRNPPAAFSLEIVTRVNPTSNTALSGLYRSGGNYCTQCEAEGFRRITYFPDRPDVMTVYTVRLEADTKEVPVLLSNGNPVERGPLSNGRHHAIWHDPHPKPSYLFALVGGDLGSIHGTYTTSDNRKVRLGIYVEKGKEERASYAMDALIRSMRWDEEVFGCTYDLDEFNIVAISDFNMGAMENKGLNIFNDKFVLADKDTASDGDFARIEAIIAHEYFHNWTGNRITCRDWFQLCLKEGLTVFRDQEFSSDMRSRGVKRIEDVVLLRSHQFPEDAGPLAHPVRPDRYREINNFYTATVYEKGAEIVRMLHTLLGDKIFRAGIRRYLKKHDGDAATVEQFVACFEAVSKRDLSQFFLWYTQAGTPVLHIGSVYDAAKQTLTVEVEQSLSPTPGQDHKRLMHIPLRLGLVGMANGADLVPSRISGAEHNGEVMELRQRKHRIVFHGIEERPALSPNRGFSAPVEVNYRPGEKELVFLAANDSDAFNRWQAMRTIATKQLFAAMRALNARKKPNWSPAFLDAVARIAADETMEPAYRAVALTLPSESEIARLIGKNIDPDAIHTARNALKSAIGEKLEPLRRQIVAALDMPRVYSPVAEDAGKRSLANLLLGYGLGANSDEAAKDLLKQFRVADNMTDREFALRQIIEEFGGSEHAQKALKKFYQMYRNDHIVLDKWFMLQSIQHGEEGLKAARALVEHKDFSWTNPNRVRSVIGAFATANQTGFNRRDGEGYRFVSDAIARLDAINPQVAARMLTAFRSWRQMEPERRKHAEGALKALKGRQGLSRDASEILDRTLS